MLETRKFYDIWGEVLIKDLKNPYVHPKNSPYLVNSLTNNYYGENWFLPGSLHMFLILESLVTTRNIPKIEAIRGWNRSMDFEKRKISRGSSKGFISHDFHIQYCGYASKCRNI